LHGKHYSTDHVSRIYLMEWSLPVTKKLAGQNCRQLNDTRLNEKPYTCFSYNYFYLPQLLVRLWSFF